MSDVPIVRAGVIAPMSEEQMDRVARAEEFMLSLPQVDIRTEHLLHAGMYARTILVPKGAVAAGALIKIATVLIVAGEGLLTVGDHAERLSGYCVIAGSAGRKQVFLALEDTYITMLFPTKAETVGQAEEEFTDDFARLMSRKEGACNRVLITGG